MENLIAMLGAFFVLMIVITVIIESLVLLAGASIAEIENRSFGKALLATVASATAYFISAYVIAVVFRTGTLFDWILAFIVHVVVVQRLFSASFGKAFAAVSFTWIAGLIFGIIGWFMLLGSLSGI